MKNQVISPKWNDPFLICEFPKEISVEMDQWVSAVREIKNHPLSELKAHINVGYNKNCDHIQNAYQCSVPFNMVQDSFWLPYVLKTCASHWGGTDIDYKLTEYPGHFDRSGVWVNFSYEGNGNLEHTHNGFISGVIYYKNNKNHPTIFPHHNKEYCGKNETMILFDSFTPHCVDVQPFVDERITFAFNIEKVS
tara:strand:+ start:54 stop:632 length:579 start_codon:yes stop_codon:yes gene_type:complete